MPTSSQALPLVADVDFAGRVVADQDRGQAGDDAVVLDELDDFLGELGADLLSQFLAVEDGCGHGEVGGWRRGPAGIARF